MWAFFQRKATAPAEPARALSLNDLAARMGDFSDLARHEAALKFWLPEPAEAALKDVCERNGESISDYLRQFFVVHCYGLYAYYAMIDAMPKLFRGDGGGVMYSRRSTPAPAGKIRVRTYWVVELGKNVAPVKLWLPGRVKRDLATLAEHAELTTSNYVREILVSRLLGHGMVPMRPEMTAMPSPELEHWVEGREEAWTQVEQDRAEQCRLVDVRYELVDDVPVSKGESLG